jgi:hypothetical protein
VNAIPPTDTCHQSTLDDILQEVDPIVSEFDAQGGIHHRLLGSTEDFRKICQMFMWTRAFRKIGLARVVGDCPKRAGGSSNGIYVDEIWSQDGKTSML